jgi:hypothetical protein
MKRFGLYGKKDAPQEPVRSLTACMANGCPLPGVFRLTAESSICRAHDEAEAVDWPGITTHVRHRIDAMHAALDMTNASSGESPPESQVQRFIAKYGERFEVRAGQTARGYGAMAFALLVKECKTDERHV